MNEKVVEFQNEVKESAGKIWLAGLGALSLAGEEGTKMFKNLVDKGKDFESREKAPVEAIKKSVDGAKDRVTDIWSKLEDSFNDKVGIALEKIGVPTRDEIQQLTDRVDALMAALEKLNTDKSE